MATKFEISKAAFNEARSYSWATSSVASTVASWNVTVNNADVKSFDINEHPEIATSGEHRVGDLVVLYTLPTDEELENDGGCAEFIAKGTRKSTAA